MDINTKRVKLGLGYLWIKINRHESKMSQKAKYNVLLFFFTF